MRAVYPDVWLKGIFNDESAIREAMTAMGAHITDVRYANESVYGFLEAEKQEVPCLLIWMDSSQRGIFAINPEEEKTTSLLKDMADVTVHNDMDILDGQLLKDVMDIILLKIYQGLTDITVSEIVDEIRIKEGVGEDGKNKKSKKTNKHK